MKSTFDNANLFQLDQYINIYKYIQIYTDYLIIVFREGVREILAPFVMPIIIKGKRQNVTQTKNQRKGE